MKTDDEGTIATSEDLPMLVDAATRWDTEARRVRYYAMWDDTNAWIEVSAEEFANVTRVSVQDAVIAIGQHVDATLTRVREVLEEFGTFREKMEDLFRRQHQHVPSQEGN